MKEAANRGGTWCGFSYVEWREEMMPSSITFSGQGQPLEVVSEREGDGWAVRLYNGAGQRVSPLVYRLSSDTAVDAQMQSGENLVRTLMLALKEEATSGRLILYPPEKLSHLKQK
jgi:hypothetical protein